MESKCLHHWYGPTQYTIGPGCIRKLESRIKRAGVTQVLLVTSRSVAADSGIIDPIYEGLGSLNVSRFDDVSINKQLDTVESAIDIVEDSAIDGIVSLGGGSTVDAARVISAVAATDADPESLFATINSDGQVNLSNISTDTLPVISVPTTLSGAEVTCAAGVNIGASDSGTRQVRSAPIISPEIWPIAIFYDPHLAARTPSKVLGASVMNGLDHGIEMLYSRNATPFTNATAAQGIRLLNDTIPSLLTKERDFKTLERAMMGIALSTMGLIDPTSGAKYSLIHAFGHQISQRYNIHQGQVHGVVAPNVLEYIFDNIESNSQLLAQALGGHGVNDHQRYIVNRVSDLRNALSLPSQLRSFGTLKPKEFSTLASAILSDIGIQFGPKGLSPSKKEIEEILDASW